MRIADIIIGERKRKDLGDIDGLARSIEDVGLLQPIIVRPDNTLVGGLRRITACSLLKWTDIPAYVAEDLEDEYRMLKAECDENTCRKGLTPSEAVETGKELEPMEQKAAKERQGTRTDLEPSSNLDRSRTDDQVAEAVGMGRTTYRKAKEVVEAAEEQPDLFADLPEKMDSGSVNAAYKEMQRRERELAREAMAKEAEKLPPSDRWAIERADIEAYQTQERFDFIITDPPYPKNYLELYGVLARRALEWLKPSGLLLAMCGQSYLDKIMEMMGGHLEYYWTGCYLTPGQPTPLRQRQVNTTWKPILIYGLPGEHYKGKIFGDVWTSEGSDKNHHEWGQSISGMQALVEQVCLPGQTILDPFCGAGTTGIAALKHGCLFRGIDIDEKAVAIAKGRLYDAQAI